MPGISDATHAGRGGLVPSLAHELRNVLANVVHSSELFADEQVGELSAQQREVAGILRENTGKLQLLVEYLAAFDCWRDQALQPQFHRFSLQPVVERCVRRHRAVASAHQIQIDYQCVDTDACLDPVCFGLILDNLLAHSVQVSPRGGKVRLEVARRGAQLFIEVADQGPAVEDGRQGEMLDRYGEALLVWKGDRPVRGGLRLARDCALALGGQLQISRSRDDMVLLQAAVPAEGGVARHDH